MNTGRYSTVHPGRVLLEDFLAPRGISVFHLAKDIGVSPRRIYEIVQGERSITPTLALRLAHYFGLSKRFWLDLQAQYDQLTAIPQLQETAGRRQLTACRQIANPRGASTAVGIAQDILAR